MRYFLIAICCLQALVAGCQSTWPWENKNAAMNRTIMDWMDFEPLSRENAEEYVFFFTEGHFGKKWMYIVGSCWGRSAGRSYNLGNAHFLAGQLPEAILAYQRGLQLDPNDAGLRDNLDYARAQVQYPSDTRGRPEVESWPTWLYQPSSFQVSAIALAFYLLTCVLISRWFMTRRRVLLFRAAVVFLLAAACGFLWLYLENHREWRMEHPLVVVHDDKVPLRKGNGPSYPVNPDMPLLARGMEARKIHERAGWLQIQFASGEVGWVEKKSVLVDEP